MFVRGQRMNFRMAKMDDLPQLKVVYEKIIEEMNCNNIKIWDEIYPLLHTDVGASVNNTFPFTATVCVATFENSAIIKSSLSQK